MSLFITPQHKKAETLPTSFSDHSYAVVLHDMQRSQRKVLFFFSRSRVTRSLNLAWTWNWSRGSLLTNPAVSDRVSLTLRSRSQLPHQVSHHSPACGTRVSTLWLSNNTFPIRLLKFIQFILGIHFPRRTASYNSTRQHGYVFTVVEYFL